MALKKEEEKRSRVIKAALFLSPRPELGAGDVKTKDIRGLPSRVHRPLRGRSSGKGDRKIQ